MVRSVVVLGGLAAAGWCLGGCYEQGAARGDQCAKICEKRELCDSRTDENDCVDACLSRTYLSSEYVSVWASCVAPSSVSCDVAMSEDAVDDCITDELRSEPISELVDDVCRALASKLAACDDADPQLTERGCQRGDSLKLAEEYLLQSRDCVDALCDDVHGCFEELADSYNTTLSIVPAAAQQSSESVDSTPTASSVIGEVSSDLDGAADDVTDALVDDAGLSF